MRNLKIYFIFLSRNKVYSAVSVLGFSISLMFVILLAIYVKQEFSVDDFQKNKERIYIIANEDHVAFANPIAVRVKEICPEVESFSRIVFREPEVFINDGKAIRANVLFADSSFFSMFSFKLREGLPSQVINLEGNAVISRSYAYKIWGDENPVGKSLNIDGINHTITGIFEDFPINTVFKNPDFIANYAGIKGYFGKNILENFGNGSFAIFFMAKEGADLPSKTPVILDDLKENYWVYKQGFRNEINFISLGDFYFKEQMLAGFNDFNHNNKTLVSIYWSISILILIIAILNYINMTVVQAGFRGKEAAIKKLMGCGRKTIIGQLLTESLLMTVFTFGLGIFLAYLAAPIFGDMLSTQLFVSTLFTSDFFLFILGFIFIVSFISGIIPALVISGFEPIEIVKGEFSRKIKMGFARILNIFQYTVAIALLICSFFIIKQIDFLMNFDIGFQREKLYIVQKSFPGDIRAGLKSKIMEIPGVVDVAFSRGTPVTWGNNSSFELEGVPLSFTEFLGDTSFLNVYGLKWEPTEITHSEKTYLVNKEGYNALKDDPKHAAIISGVLNDFQIKSLRESSGMIWVRHLSGKDRAVDMTVKLSSFADPFKTADAIKNTYTDFTGVEVFDSFFADEKVQAWYEKETKMSKIIMSFSFLTIVIMIMGVFAMSLYTIKQKEKGIAIRKVNGSTELEILGLLNRDTLINILISAVFSIPIAYYGISHWLDNFIYKTTLSWWIFLACVIIVTVITSISVSWLTWRAATANPIKALRNE